MPKSDMPGEEAWPTQPFPTKPPPFARQKFTVDDLNPYLTPEDRARFRDEILSARNEGLFTPPGDAAARSRCPATTAEPTGAAPPSIRRTAI